jgi:zinc protease
MQFYRDRFADASDFTFVIVGNFTVDSIKPLVLTWLGGCRRRAARRRGRTSAFTRPRASSPAT